MVPTIRIVDFRCCAYGFPAVISFVEVPKECKRIVCQRYHHIVTIPAFTQRGVTCKPFANANISRHFRGPFTFDRTAFSHRETTEDLTPEPPTPSLRYLTPPPEPRSPPANGDPSFVVSRSRPHCSSPPPVDHSVLDVCPVQLLLCPDLILPTPSLSGFRASTLSAATAGCAMPLLL